MDEDTNEVLVYWNCPNCGAVQTSQCPDCNCDPETKWLKLDIDKSRPIILTNFDMIDGKLVKVH